MPSKNSKPTQSFLPIKDIRDGVVMLEDGGLRMVLIVSSINFALKGEDEQAALLMQYQNFLNSLDFHIQIFLQSRRLDIRPYLATLESKEKEQLNELLKIQTREYIQFIRSFTDSTNIMAKTFFVVVPYDPPVLASNSGGVLSKLPWGKAPTENAKGEKIDAFEEQRGQLEQRASVVEQGLSRVGLRVAALGTEELVELYFKLFNPGETAAPTIG